MTLGALLALSGKARADIPLVERPDTEFLILALDANGVLRSEGIDAYLPAEASAESILLPLGALSEALNLSIETDPAAGIVSGFFLTEDNFIALDIAQNQLNLRGEKQEIPPGTLEAHYDDIYVQAKTLEQWFDWTIRFEPSTLTAYITADTPFPFEEASQRKKKAEKLLTQLRSDTRNQQNAEIVPYQWISKPVLNLQTSLSGTSSESGSTVNSLGNTQVSFDVLKFGADLNITTAYERDTGSTIRDARLILSRSDPTNQMLGPLKAGRIDIGDITMPDVPLSIGGQRGRGIVVSSETEFGFRLSQQNGVVTIDGDAPNGWDVELYRNGQFIDFQTIATNGQFLFEDVQLISGFNRFQILLFGPEGQKRTLTRDIFSGPNMLSKGTVKYDLSIANPQADFLPVSQTKRTDSRIGIGAKASYGLSNFLTVGGSFYQGPEDDEEEESTLTATTLSLDSAFWGFNTQLQYLYTDNNQNAWQTALRRKFLGFNIAGSYTSYDRVANDDDDELSHVAELSLSRRFAGISLTLMGEKQVYEDAQDDKSIITNILSSDIFGLRLTNELTKTISENETVDDLEGELSLFTDILDTRIRSALTYDLDPQAEQLYRTFRLSAQRQITDKSNLRLTTNYDFTSGITALDMRCSYEMDPYAFDFDLGADSANSYRVGVSWRTSLQPDEKGKYRFISSKKGSLASVGIHAFIDANGNEKYDPGEKSVADVGFLANRNKASARTNEDGYAWINSLAEAPTSIFVNDMDIPSIYLVPVKRNIDLIPRRGTNKVIEYAFTQLGEIDGFVVTSDDEQPLANIPVRLVDRATQKIVDEVQSEGDGFYLFTAIPLGEYSVIASDGWFDEGEADTDSQIITLTVDEPDAYNTDLLIMPNE